MIKDRNTGLVNHRYSSFVGLDTVSDSTKLSVGESGIRLTKAKNVNVTKSMSIERRDGYSVWLNGVFSSLWGNDSNCYAVNNGNLVELNDDKTTTVIYSSVGSYPMSFVDARNGWVYFTNGVFLGKIKNGSVTMIRGTDAQPSTSDQFKGALPAGDFLSFLSPRILVVKKNVVYISDAINRDIYHQHTGFIQFDTNVRMVAPLSSGDMFVSDSRFTWFLRKMQAPAEIPAPLFKLVRIANYPAVKGNAVVNVDSIQTEKNIYQDAVMWVSEKGICVGGMDGGFENLTDQKYRMPEVIEKAYITDRYINGNSYLISTIKGM